MGRDTCKMPGCDKETRDADDYEYPDNPDATTSDGERFTVGRYGAKFCSTYHELKYDKMKDEARDARAAEMEENRRDVPKKDLPEYDGPPY